MQTVVRRRMAYFIFPAAYIMMRSGDPLKIKNINVKGSDFGLSISHLSEIGIYIESLYWILREELLCQRD